MKKTLNKFLKFLGFNVVKAKRARKPRSVLASLARDQKTRAALNAAVVKTFTEGRPPYTEEELNATARSHYIGDSCPGGHAEWETAGGTTPEQNEAREFPKQPSSDNNITGPTS